MHDKGAVLIEEFRYPSNGKPAPSILQDLQIINCDSEIPRRETGRPKELHDRSDNRENEYQAQLAEEAQRSFAAGRVQGVEEGRRLEREEQGTRLQEIEKKKIQETAQLAEQLASERDIFLHALEQETVQLSLSVASRILRREAQMDPLFLVGAVRVALGQLAETATVRLRVPAADAGLWSETIAHLPSLRLKPTVIGDEKMRLGDCFLETDLGTADLGVASQLTEIARGLVDGESLTNSHQALSAGWETAVPK